MQTFCLVKSYCGLESHTTRKQKRMETVTETRRALRRNPARLQAIHQAIQAEHHMNRDLDSTLLHAARWADWKSLYKSLDYCEIPAISKRLGKERHAYLIEMIRSGRTVNDFFWTMTLVGGDSDDYDSES